MKTTTDIISIRQWVLYCTTGWITGVILILILSGWLDSLGIENMQFYTGTGMGAGIGFMQWLILKKKYGIGLNWFWLSVAGMTLPFIAADLLYSGQSEFKLGICVTTGALITGFLQSHLLKNKFRYTFSWITTTWLAWTLAALPVLFISFTMKIRGEGINNLFLALINLILILAGGPLLGIISFKGIRQLQRP